MRLLSIVPLLALSSATTAEPSSTSPEAEVAARQVPAAQINVYCIAHEAKAPVDDFNTTFKEACHDYSNRELQVGEQATYEKCFDDYCITTLLVFKCGNETSTSSVDYNSCRTLFDLPWNTPGKTCVSGGYVGSPVPGACWTALSLATPKSSDDRLPALSNKAWSNVESPTISTRQAPQGVTACVPEDWQYSVTDDEFYADANHFCAIMVEKDVTLSTGQSYWSENAYCNDENCLNFYVDFYCAAPGGGEASGNVHWQGCMEFILHPWWGYDLISGHGPCVQHQGNEIKGRWVTDVDPNACWNFSSLVLAPLSEQKAMPSLPPAEHYWHNPFVIPGAAIKVAKVPPQSEEAGLDRSQDTSGHYMHNPYVVPGAAINVAKVPRQSEDASLDCSQDTFESIFDVFCMLYEYCPILNDQPFNITQHFEVGGQQVALSVVHSGACLTGGKAGHETCVKALEGALDNVCKTGRDPEEGLETHDCWDFSISVEPSI